MTFLVSQTTTEPDGVNLLPLIILIVLLVAAAVVVYARRRRKPSHPRAHRDRDAPL